MTVSDVFKQEAYAQETDAVFVVLITLSSDELTDPIRLCSDPYEPLPAYGDDIYGMTSNGDDYIFVPFEISLPRDDKSGTVSAKLSIENVDRRIIETARSVTKPVTVKMQCVLNSDPDTIELEFDNFQLSNVKYDVMAVEGELTLNYWGLEPFPSYTFTPANFPALF